MRTVVLALGLSLPLTLAAQQPDSIRGDTARLATTVVTATTLDVPAVAPSAPATVITEQELRARGATTLAEVLATVPSAAPTRSGSFGATTSLFFRGGERDYVQVLVDGVPINDPGGDVDLANLSLENVERIEVVRGPASALYGSEAMTGVIQLFTREGRGPVSLQVGARAGTFETREGEASVQAGSERASVTLAAARTQTDGILAFNNRYRNGSLGATARARLDGRSDARLSVQWRDGIFHYPTDGDGHVVDRNAFRTERRLVASLDVGRRVSDRVDAHLRLGMNHARLRNDDAQDDATDTQGFYAFESRTRFRRESADARANIALRPDAVITLGAELARERETTASHSESEFGPSDVPEESADRLNRAVYAQLFANARQAATLTLGGRLEDNEAFGAFATYRASAGVRVGSGTRLRAGAGSAFKAPTVLEHYGTSGFVMGNPDLDPERSRSWDVGLDQTLFGSRLTIGATYFDQHFRDMIAIVAGPTDAFTYANVDAARSHGLELEATAHLAAFTARASASWLSTRDETTDERLLRRPGFMASATAAYLLRDRASLSATVHHSGARPDNDFSVFPAERVTLAPFTTLDLAAETTLVRTGSTRLALTVRAMNVLDETYEQVLHFETPGRSLLLGARIDLQP
jgi:vitamin B12 transporter